jgi:hypothetical protein
MTGAATEFNPASNALDSSASIRGKRLFFLLIEVTPHDEKRFDQSHRKVACMRALLAKEPVETNSSLIMDWPGYRLKIGRS